MPANRLGYCGPAESWRTFMRFTQKPTEELAADAKKLLTRFYALYPYLELIARVNSLQPFDAEVVEAYWLGNKLLENVQYSELQKTLLSFQRFGLPRSIAEKKAAELPDALLPHHSSHVLYVNFISPKVEPVVANLSNCLVQWAAVKGETKNGIRVKGIELFAEAAELKLKEKTKTIQNPFSLHLNEAAFAAVHWGSAIEPLARKQLRNLQNYTIKNLHALAH